MTTNPGNPAALSHPLWLSRGSLSIRSPGLSPSRVCIYHHPLLSTSTILRPVHRNILFPIRFSVYLSFYSLQPRQFPPLACGFYARFRARVFALPYIYHVHAAYVCMYVCETLQTAARFIHLLGSVPGCCTPPSPVCEGGGPRSYATRDPRAGSSPRTTETRRRRMRKRTRRLRARGNWKCKGDEMQQECIIS